MKGKRMKLGIIINQTDPETVFNTLRQSEGSAICPLSTLKDYYEIVRDSDRLVTV